MVRFAVSDCWARNKDGLRRFREIESSPIQTGIIEKDNMMKWRGEGKIDKQNGGVGLFARCVLEMEPHTPDAGILFVNAITGGKISAEYVSAIETGVREAAANGVLAGYPVVDIKVTLLDGAMHAVDSNPTVFRQAAILAFREAASLAPMVILEPIALLNLETPREYMGGVIADIMRRRGGIQGQEYSGDNVTVSALIPLAETVGGYATALRSLTQGRASYTLTPVGYDETPRRIQERIISMRA